MANRFFKENAGAVSKLCAQACRGVEADALSRRAILSGGAFLAGTAVLAPLRARAMQKVTQAAAHYQTSPKNGQQCGSCAHFQAPSSCAYVEGSISPNGWCALYAKKS